MISVQLRDMYATLPDKTSGLGSVIEMWLDSYTAQNFRLKMSVHVYSQWWIQDLLKGEGGAAGGLGTGQSPWKLPGFEVF